MPCFDCDVPPLLEFVTSNRCFQLYFLYVLCAACHLRRVCFENNIIPLPKYTCRFIYIIFDVYNSLSFSLSLTYFFLFISPYFIVFLTHSLFIYVFLTFRLSLSFGFISLSLFSLSF